MNNAKKCHDIVFHDQIENYINISINISIIFPSIPHEIKQNVSILCNVMSNIFNVNQTAKLWHTCSLKGEHFLPGRKL